MAKKKEEKKISRKTDVAEKKTELRTETGTLRVKVGLAEMLKGGVIMDVTNADQARIAEDAGAVAVMALERVPADIRIDLGGEDDTPASKARKGLVHVLESMNAALGVKLRRRVRRETDRPPAPTAIADMMKNIIETIRIIEGSGHQTLALESLAMNFQPDSSPAPKG